MAACCAVRIMARAIRLPIYLLRLRVRTLHPRPLTRLTPPHSLAGHIARLPTLPTRLRILPLILPPLQSPRTREILPPFPKSTS